MTKPSQKQTTYKTKQQTQGGQLAPRQQAEDEPTKSNSTSIASASKRNVESVRGVPGAHPWPLGRSEPERASGIREPQRAISPDGPKARSCDASAEQAPGTPKLGRGNNIQNNPHKQRGCPGADTLWYRRWYTFPVHPRTPDLRSIGNCRN